ncbi:MAG: HDOD domain-containing protein [Opitutales bacterium]|nr:HDOD domain-containing protein [Opitutales bacterium]
MSNPFLGLDHPPPSARLLSAILNADTAARSLETLRREDGGVRAFLGVRFAGGPEAVSGADAAMRFSLARTSSLALAADLAGDGLECYGLAADTFVERGLAVAAWAEALAERTGGDRAATFSLGMLYRAGMVPVARMLARVKPDVRISVGRLAPQIAREREEARIDCLQAGARLLEMWGFPDFAVKAVRHQHHPLLHAGRLKVTVLLALAVSLGEAMQRGTLRAAADALPEAMLDEVRLERITLHDCSAVVEESWQRMRDSARAAVPART